MKKQTIMKSTDRVRYNYYSIDFACVSIEFITKSQCMDGKSVWMESGLRSAIQKEVLIFIVEDISSI